MGRKLFSTITLLVLGTIFLLLPEPSFGAVCNTTVPAGLVAGQTWTLAGSPYCVTGDIQVSLLTIEPGVEVLVDGPFRIDVLSTITAVGTAVSPIRFSANLPSPPDNQRWKGIKFQNTPAGSELNNVIIEFSDDGGITIINSVPPVISNATIRDNSRVGEGGGISATGLAGDFVLSNCTFSGNTSTLSGGGLSASLNPGFTLNITGSLFENNTANPSLVGGPFVGGGLSLVAGDGNISNSEFVGNRSNSQCVGTFGCNVLARGGAIFIGSSGNVTLKNNVIHENQTDAFNQGGCFFGGITESYGGGLYVDSGTVTLTNNILSCNTTTWNDCRPVDGGGGLYVNGGAVTVDNSTIARNLDATGVELAGTGTLDIMDSIIYNNNADGVQVGNAPTITYSDVQGANTGLGNIDVNPVFAGVGCLAGDLTIVLGSPAIDTGNPNPVYNDGCLPPGLGSILNDQGAHGGPDNCGWNPLAVPNISVLPVAFNFGNQTVGTTSTAKTFVVTNTGATDLVIGSTTLTGVNTLEFTIDVDSCSLQTITPSSSCLLNVIFAPASAGPKSADISIPSNDFDTPTLSVPLSGTAIAVVTDPVPDIKANGSDGPLTIAQGTNLTATVALNPGLMGGTNADWWLVAIAPSGTFHYQMSTSTWMRGDSVTYQGPLMNLPPTEVVNISTLPAGVYTIFFAVDTTMNGLKDAPVFSDSVGITITP